MKYIGSHLSISKGFLEAAKKTTKNGGNTYQYFSRNPRGGARKEIDIEDINGFKEYANDNGFGQLICHAPYTLNPSSSKEEVREFAKQVFKEDIELLELFPNSLYNFHPGSHVGQGVEIGIKETIDILNEVMYEGMKTTILLETMAGKGSEIGSNFSELKQIMDGVKYKDNIGVCLDTCHVWDAGYDLFNKYDEVFNEFDAIIGLNKLKAMHLNDSKNPLGSHKDRHEIIGKGFIGIDVFKRIVNDKRFDGIPMCLETPHTNEDEYMEEISFLKSLRNE